ncbi:hypothetical protein C4580_02490 [Candidatus Woesearchaeota archaeon]|nr:MAG: hypothetical protein C4580_02490 [Candidatus Woesearchaeota archaeon]
MLTPYDWIYGIAVLTAVFLSVIAGLLAASLFKRASERKVLRAWRPLILALVLFAVLEIFGALKVFGVYPTVWVTHVLASLILMLLIAALVTQREVARGWE